MLELGEFTLTRSELRKIWFVDLYMQHGVDIQTLAQMPGFEFINEEIKRVMGENFFEGAHIEDLGGRIVTDWNTELKTQRSEDPWLE